MQPSLAEFVGKGFAVYVVSHGSKDDIDYLSPLGYKILINDTTAWDAYGIEYIPDTFFVDRNGVVVEAKVGWEGDKSVAEFKAMVEQLTATGG